MADVVGCAHLFRVNFLSVETPSSLITGVVPRICKNITVKIPSDHTTLKSCQVFIKNYSQNTLRLLKTEVLPAHYCPPIANFKFLKPLNL